LLCNPGRPWTCDLLDSAPLVTGLQACTNMLIFLLYFVSVLDRRSSSQLWVLPGLWRHFTMHFLPSPTYLYIMLERHKMMLLKIIYY
jgi:hypothetical protein